MKKKKLKSERKVKYGTQKTLTLAILFSVLTFISVSIGCVLVWGMGSHAGLPSTLDVPITGTSGDFTDVATEYGVNDSRQGKATVWFDYDNDGDPDILLTVFKGNYTILYRNDGDKFVDVAKVVGLPAIRGSLSVGDYDNDGDIDILCGGLFRNDINETNSFTEVGSYGDTFVDYDNDGDLDLYVVNGRGERCSLYRNDVDTIGLFTDVTAEMKVGDTGRYANSASWGDYDNDGDLDLYVVNGVSKAPSHLYRNDISEGNGFVKTVEMANAGSAMGGSWGDFDSDGDIDYYLVGSYPGYVMRNRLYQNNNSENGNHWLHINAIGTISNRAAIGTTIQVVAGDLTQLRYVESSSGYGSQNSLPVEFGLGAHSTVDSVIIKWPSGRVQNLTDVEVNQFLTVFDRFSINLKKMIFPTKRSV